MALKFTDNSFSRGILAGKVPGLIFTHGGPIRQMLLGFHYMGYYHNAYAENQYLASRGFAVLSVNYRLGIMYGRAFREALNTMWRGIGRIPGCPRGGSLPPVAAGNRPHQDRSVGRFLWRPSHSPGPGAKFGDFSRLGSIFTGCTTGAPS